MNVFSYSFHQQCSARFVATTKIDYMKYIPVCVFFFLVSNTIIEYS